MEKKINFLDIILVLLALLVCLALVVTLIKFFSGENGIVVYRVSVSDDTAEIIKPGDILYGKDGVIVGKVVSIGSLDRKKTIDIESEYPDLFMIGEDIELRTQRIFMSGTVYSVNRTEDVGNEK